MTLRLPQRPSGQISQMSVSSCPQCHVGKFELQTVAKV